MVNLKCPVCGAVCNPSLTSCDICGSALPTQAPAQPVGFGQPAGFGQTTGFGQPATQGGFGHAVAGFGSQPVQTGFGFQPAQTGFGVQPVDGVGVQPAQNGFGQTTNAFSVPNEVQTAGFGQTPNMVVDPIAPGLGGVQGFAAPPSYEAKPSNGLGAVSPEAARFADAVSAHTGMSDTVYWGFKACILFLLKGLIPIYGLIIMLMCLIGNPRKYPTVLTNYLRASLVFSVIVMLLLIILTMSLDMGAVNTLISYGG